MYTADQIAENRAKWVAALRSGEYAQTRGVLERVEADADGNGPVGFCCLGVACHVLVFELRRDPDDGESHATYETIAAFLPGEVARMLGTDHRGTLNSTLADSLTELNDDRGYSFEQIADVIESGAL